MEEEERCEAEGQEERAEDKEEGEVDKGTRGRGHTDGPGKS